MAEFTQQQQAILTSAAKNNLVDTLWRTGKTAVLIRKYLNFQESPTAPPKAIFLTSNGLATQRVMAQLRNITQASWEDQLIGTISEVGYKLLKRHATDLTYSRVPKIISDMSAAHEREAARVKALSIQSDTHSSAFGEQWNQEFVHHLRHSNIATPRSLMIEAVNFLRLSHPSVAQTRMLLVDNAHDFTMEELMALSAIQQHMGQSFIAGNTNIATYEAVQNIDPGSGWFLLTSQDDYKRFPLSTCFGLPANHGLFLQQLSAYNSKRIFENNLCFAGKTSLQNLIEVRTSSRPQMLAAVSAMKEQLQLAIRGQTLAVIMRNPNDCRSMARELGCRPFLLLDKHRICHRYPLPEREIYCTTPFEVPYLNPDYVVMPSCIERYWPYKAERHDQNTRRMFCRAVSSARNAVFFMTPDLHDSCSPSPFISEGCTPKLVTTATTMPVPT